MQRRHRATLLPAIATIVAACTVGPDYVRPTAEAPPEYKEAQAWKPAQPADEVPKDDWWRIYGDNELDALEAQVDVSNQNIKVAEARLRQARAATDAARAAYFPTVSADASATRSRSPAGRGDTGGTTSNSFNIALDALWELDLWGRVRRSVESSEASAQASAADLEAARLSIHAELAQDYWLLRVQDAQIRLLNETAAAYGKSLQLVKNQYAAGTVARVELVQSETQLKSTQAQAIDAGVLRAQLEHAIATLIGQPPATFSIAPTEMNASVPTVPAGVPSELLERRPDIAGAERRMAAANAQIGVAKAAYFPTLSLSATGGFQSSTIAKLLTLPSRYWSLGPALAATLFDAGLRRAQTEQAIAAYDASVATYRQTVLAAFQEVEDNLAALRILEQEWGVQEDAVRAARESVALTTNQYRAGTVNYLAVVVVQAAALNNERAALGILARRLTASVVLIKALGGGWRAPETSPAG